jgi:hypothetical protein
MGEGVTAFATKETYGRQLVVRDGIGDEQGRR